MHLRHRQMDRQTDTSIVAQVRDVYITSHANDTASQCTKFHCFVRLDIAYLHTKLTALA